MTSEEAAETIFEKAVLAAKRPAKIIDMPGYPGLKVALLVPSDEEAAQAQASTLFYLTSGGLKLDEFKLSLTMESKLYEAEYERQLLVRVLRNPNAQDLPFATIQSLREGLTAQSRDMIMRILERWTAERNPQKDLEATPERLVELVRTLKAEAALPDWLMSCNFATLISIALALAEALPSVTAPPSSDTGPSSAPTSD